MNALAVIDLLGTLGPEGGGDIRGFEFYDNAVPALRKLHALGLSIVIITNHSHIAKGLLTLEEFFACRDVLRVRLMREKIMINGFLFCPHAKADGCDCRKPRTGLVDRFLETSAADGVIYDIRRSYVIGDIGKSDGLLAKNLGAKGILVLTGRGRESLGAARGTWSDYEPYAVAENILGAADIIEKDIRP